MIKTIFRKTIGGFFLILFLFLVPLNTYAQNNISTGQKYIGFKIKAGGRYDNVRMCVATPAGTKGGPSLELTFYAETMLSEKVSLSFDLPVFRPILFAASFKMLQFEPDVSLLFRTSLNDKIDFVTGPTLGLAFHYGPDYQSSNSGTGRGRSFFAMGPQIGAFFGLNFRRPNKTMNFQLGIQPYITPLFSISDSANHNGIVAGATVVSVFRFSTRKK